MEVCLCLRGEIQGQTGEGQDIDDFQYGSATPGKCPSDLKIVLFYMRDLWIRVCPSRIYPERSTVLA